MSEMGSTIGPDGPGTDGATNPAENTATVTRETDDGETVELPEKYADATIGGYHDGIIQEGEIKKRIFIDVTRDGEQVVFWFDIGDVSWHRKNQLLSANISQGGADSSGRVDIAGYYRDVAELAIVEWSGSGEGDLTTFLTGMSDDIGEQLQPHLPDPAGALTEENEGN